MGGNENEEDFEHAGDVGGGAGAAADTDAGGEGGYCIPSNGRRSLLPPVNF